MKKVSFCTLGCKVNQYETEAMSSLFKQRGYEIASFDDVCDIYIINTCTVTGEGERKSRQMIRRAHSTNPDSTIVVTGCMSQVSPEKVAQMEGVSIVMGTSERTRIVDNVEEYIRENKKPGKMAEFRKTVSVPTGNSAGTVLVYSCHMIK